ncbi:cell division cycle 7-related protein kinase isoform X2 [Agrilus planipennis]|uniref:non-specific serine/threonine protein kinase n=1 Tax=Agrilus planipennis TaxID=224129 RepID=A0A1W4XV23_AGRPL|nr:cell division cycle 7-related protein kinase isoform X2 [Agrilus planipennis]
MPPNCTPEKNAANLISPNYEGENLYFNPTISNTEQKEVKIKNESHVEQLLNDLPNLNKLFFIHSKIGEGTFSSVYLATLKQDLSKRKKFAIKHLIPTCHPNRIKFELECLKKFGGRDNIIGIELCLRSKNNIVFAMPYQPHLPFVEFVGDMDAKESSDYIKNLLIALAKLHDMGIIHRDIKPSNFLYDRKNRRYVLVDFGLAQVVPNNVTNSSNDSSLKRKRNSFSPQYNGKVIEDNKRPNIDNSPSTSLINTKNSIKDQKENNCFQNAHNIYQKVIAEGSKKQDIKGNCRCYGKPRVCSHCLVKRSIQASRAGTPGFRPPEVLLKYPDQTTAVDIWAVGVIFMCILSNCTTFFTSLNDNMALAEMISLFGTEKINRLSQKLGRYLLCSEHKEPVNLKNLCNLLRKRKGNNSKVEETEKCCKCSKLIQYCFCTSSSKDTNDAFPESAYDLLLKFLDIDPKTRITAKEALKHEYLSI